MNRATCVVYGADLIEFIFAALFALALQDVWTDAWDPSKKNVVLWKSALAVVALAACVILWVVKKRLTDATERDNVQLKKDLAEATQELTRYAGRVEYHCEKAFDNTFARVLEKLRQRGNYAVRLLNYTGTAFPDSFCHNAAHLLSLAVNRAIPAAECTPEAIAIRLPQTRDPTTSEGRLIDFPRLLELVRTQHIGTVSDLLHKIGASRQEEVEADIEKLRIVMPEHRDQAAYLMWELFSLWDPDSQFRLTRMYYLAPDSAVATLEKTSERFMFACASIVTNSDT